MSNAKTIEIVFENSDTVKLLPTEFDGFRMFNPVELITCSECQLHTSVFLECVNFTLKKNKVFYEQGEEDWKTTLYERMKRNDITQIYIELEDGEVKRYGVDYEDLDENDLCSPNKNQSWKEEDGQLTVTIGKKESGCRFM